MQAGKSESKPVPTFWNNDFIEEICNLPFVKTTPRELKRRIKALCQELNIDLENISAGRKTDKRLVNLMKTKKRKWSDWA